GRSRHMSIPVDNAHHLDPDSPSRLAGQREAHEGRARIADKSRRHSGPDRPGAKPVGRPAVGGAGRPAPTPPHDRRSPPPHPPPTTADPHRCASSYTAVLRSGLYRQVMASPWGNVPACPAVTTSPARRDPPPRTGGGGGWGRGGVVARRR